ncbi:DUF952 domain-containing protein [Paracoccus sp. Z330]|uniref:DUF952 domain-containing protein n=1 Tax=Paracoccus onchidii TaxID=3017813 RepID=A0ABT4ZFA1_9RHOB|nr:DUF952 domain-containing protein [Paracoccus onchidii]MDB6178042.1 DUF952 domain-containing protein [Paracoccus onchidii]
MIIYKIFRQSEWDAFKVDRSTPGAPIDLQDGYIHFSTRDQVAGTLAKHFAAENDLVLLAIDSARLGPKLIWEEARGGDLFPHLYRALRMDEVLWSRSIELTSQGHATGPLE